MTLTLRSKLIFFSIFIVTFIMADVTYFFTIRQLRDRRSDFESQMQQVAESIAHLNLLDQQNWSQYQEYISRLAAFNDDIVFIAIYDDRDWLRAQTLNVDLVDISDSKRLSRRQEADLIRRLDSGLIADESKNDLRVHQVNIQKGDRVLGSVHVGFSLIKINKELETRVIRNIIMAAIFIMLYSVIAALLSRRLTGPLERLSNAMASISKGNLDIQVEIENTDEIGQLAQTFNRMVRGLRERQIIEELGRDLSQSFQLQPLANLVLDRLSRALGAHDGRLFLREKLNEDRFREVVTGNGVSRPGVEFRLDLSSRLYFEEHIDGFPMSKAPDPIQTSLDSVGVAQSEIVVPMLIKKRLFGFFAFVVEESLKEQSHSRHLAAILANQAAMALENARLYDELREQARAKRELEIAREVQLKLLPDAMPEIKGFDFDGICKPALEVGGDYFDFFQISPQKLGIVIADVSGKGTSASFYMAEIKGMMSTLVNVHSSPRRLAVELNQRLYTSFDKQLFATMLYGVLDTKKRSFTFVRAGHDALIQVSSEGHCELITPKGIGLGLDPSELFEKQLEERELRIKQGDHLLLFTDGITESMNQRREEFGEARLLDTARCNGMADAASLRNKVFAELESFVDGAQQHDDLTMVIVHRTS